MSSEMRRRASHVLNVILAVTAVALALPRSKPAPAASVNMTNETPPSSRQPKSPHYLDAASAAERRRWLVGQLRAMGVPNNILARVVLADLDKGWNKRGAELGLKCYGDPDKMAALQLEIDVSKDADMRAALGEEGFRQWDQTNMLREVNQGKIPLTAFESDQAYDLWTKLHQSELGLEQAKVEATMDPADITDATDKAISEFKQQMKDLLGDERYAKSQQPDDTAVAASLQQQLAVANPSDAQFRELLKAQQQWNQSLMALDPSSPDHAAQITALNDARDQGYQSVLGADALDAFLKEQDPSYFQMMKNETVWGLDDDQINSVYASIKYYENSVQDYQSQARALEAQGQQVDWNAVNMNLQQFADQTQQAIQDYVGQDTFDKMQRNGVFQFSLPDLTAHGPPSQ
ncbi:MAG: hypothetical protein ACLQU4_20505 [Limisphaerales bacterium]